MSDESTGRAGIFDGFEGYRTPMWYEYQSALQEALVVLDSSVLLDMYRYNRTSRHAIVEVCRNIGDRLWVPHQVATEFWRNRERALKGPKDDARLSTTKLETLQASAIEELRSWVNRRALPSTTASNVESSIKVAFMNAISAINASRNIDQIGYAVNTHQDDVVQLLESVLLGKVGDPMSEQDFAAALTEGARRVAGRIPPGYEDIKKEDIKKASPPQEGAAGDYLVWEQTMREASVRKSDVVFVTTDMKGDWWRLEGTNRRGPRNELVQELKGRSGKQLFMMHPRDLLSHAREAFSMEISDELIGNVSQASRPQIEVAFSTNAMSGVGRSTILSILNAGEVTLFVKDVSVLDGSTEGNSIGGGDRVEPKGSIEYSYGWSGGPGGSYEPHQVRIESSASVVPLLITVPYQ